MKKYKFKIGQKVIVNSNYWPTDVNGAFDCGLRTGDMVIIADIFEDNGFAPYRVIGATLKHGRTPCMRERDLSPYKTT